MEFCIPEEREKKEKRFVVVLINTVCCFVSRPLCILNEDLYFPDIRCYNDGLRQHSDLIICFALQFSVHFKGQSLRTNRIERLPAALCIKDRKSQHRVIKGCFFVVFICKSIFIQGSDSESL